MTAPRFLRRHRTAILFLTVMMCAAILTTLMKPHASTIPYAVDNPHKDGAQALATLLDEDGIDVIPISSYAHLLHEAREHDTTVAILGVNHLSPSSLSELAKEGADITVLGAEYASLGGLTPSGDVRSTGNSSTTATLTAQCQDADATAAGSLAVSSDSVTTAHVPGAIGCFPVAVRGADDPQEDPSYAYVTAPTAGGGTLRVIVDPTILTNSRLATAGHAALAIRALGHHERVLWYDASQPELSPTIWHTHTVPRWLPLLLAQGVLIVLVLALVRGRRFGRLVTENLPTPVQPTETTRGRARLYRAVGARSHAAQALRAASAARMGARLGVAPIAGRAGLIEAIARATGRDERSIEHLLYGAPPSSDHSLATLAAELDRLENEVHHS